MLIGLTGQIGAGKSTAAQILAKLGAHVISADAIGKQVVDQSMALRKKLARRFGQDILDRRGNLRRRELARRAFLSEASGLALNKIIHPYLLKELRHQMKMAVKKHDLVVIDAALLLYWHMEREVDYVLVIHASRSLRFSRMARRGISKTDAMARQKAQLPYREFQKRSDILILNNGTRSRLQAKLRRFLRSIRTKTD